MQDLYGCDEDVCWFLFPSDAAEWYNLASGCHALHLAEESSLVSATHSHCPGDEGHYAEGVGGAE